MSVTDTKPAPLSDLRLAPGAAAGALILPYQGALPKIDKGAFVAPTATVIGNVEIGARTGIWFQCTLRGDINFIRIGAQCNLQDGTVVHVDSATFPTIIGDNVTIGHMALIHACTIESGAFIGMKACVMDGAVVEEGAMVAAGALVPPGKRVPKGQVWAGTPARFLREMSDKDRAMATRITPGYWALAQRYLAAGIGVVS